MAIIGNGDIGIILQEVDRKDLLFFASGVSNSRETRESEYQREIDLLLKQNTLKHLVYFSSLSIFYNNGRYQQHKREMEELVKENFFKYTIIRLGNIAWGQNPHTIINYLSNKIKNHAPYEVQNVYRYICDKDEFLHWINLIPEWSCEMNIPGKRMKVREIVEKYI